MSEAVSVERSDDQLRLRGPLTFDTVPELEHRLRKAFRHEGLPTVIDLTEARPADSAGFALVLEWLAQARARGATIEFRNPPPQLLTLAGLSDAQGILNWADDRVADRPERAPTPEDEVAGS